MTAMRPLGAAVVLLLAAHVQGQILEKTLGASTATDQVYPDVARLSDTTFVSVWQHHISGGDYRVKAQMYTTDGITVGSEIDVTGVYTRNLLLPVVSGLTGGGFVVIHQGVDADSSYGVYGQRFDASGAAVGAPLHANTEIAMTQNDARVAGLKGGGFVVIWKSGAQDGSVHGVYARVFNADGTYAGGEMQVNSYTTSSQQLPGVAALEDGGFIAVWQSYYQPGDNSGEGVVGQRYSLVGGLPVKAGAEFLVNTVTTRLQQARPAVAGLSSGGFVVAWESNANDGSGYGVVAKVYDAAGVGGLSEVMNNYRFSTQQHADVSSVPGTDAFIVTWESAEQDGSGRGVYFQRLAVTGNVITKNGIEVRANSYTIGDQQYPKVSVLSANHHALTWQTDTVSTGVDSVVAIITSSVGGLTNAPPPGPPVDTPVPPPVDGGFNIHSPTAHEQTFPRLARLVSGDWVAVWMSSIDGASDFEVRAQRFASNGAMMGPHISVSGTIRYANLYAVPAITALTTGGYVVAWSAPDAEGYGIYAQRLTDQGYLDGLQVTVNSFKQRTQTQARLAGLKDGRWVCVWRSEGQDSSQTSVHLQAYNFNGATAGVELQVNEFEAYHQQSPDVAAIGDGGFVVVWQSFHQDGSGDGCFGRRYTMDTGLPVAHGSEFLINVGVTQGQQFHPRVAGLHSGGWLVTWDSEWGDANLHAVHARAFTSSGEYGAYVVVNTYTDGNQWGGAVSNINGTDAVMVAWKSSAADHPVYVQRLDVVGLYTVKLTSEQKVTCVTESDVLVPDIVALDETTAVVSWESVSTNAAGACLLQAATPPPAVSTLAPGTTPRPADSSGGARPVEGEDQISTKTEGDQAAPHVCALNTGGFLSIWQQAAAGFTNKFEVVAQRYSSAGLKVGIEVTIVTQVARGALHPSCTSITGGFVGVFQGDDADNYGILMQRFSEEGQPLGGPTLVNTEQTHIQEKPSVAGLTGGGFVVAWTSLTQDTELNNEGATVVSNGVYGQVFASDGTKVGSELHLNTFITHDQLLVSVAALTDGGFVGAWQSEFQDDGRTSGIVTQAFSMASGMPVKVGPEVVVTLGSGGAERRPSVAGLSDGNYVVVWDSTLGHINGLTVIGRVYTTAGTPVVDEFIVNTYAPGDQHTPYVVANANAFFVVWVSGDQDGSGDGVYLQVFNYDGSSVTTLGTETRVNEHTADGQKRPRAASLTGTEHRFVVSWESEGQDGSGLGVFLQIFRRPYSHTPPPQTVAPTPLPDTPIPETPAPNTPGPAGQILCRVKTGGSGSSSSWQFAVRSQSGTEHAWGSGGNIVAGQLQEFVIDSPVSVSDLSSLSLHSLTDGTYVEYLEVYGLQQPQEWGRLILPKARFFRSAADLPTPSPPITPAPTTGAPVLAHTLKLRYTSGQGSTGQFPVTVTYTDGTTQDAGFISAPQSGTTATVDFQAAQQDANVVSIRIDHGGPVGWRIEKFEVYMTAQADYVQWVLPLYGEATAKWIDGDNADTPTYLEWEPLKVVAVLPPSSPVIKIRMKSWKNPGTSRYPVYFGNELGSVAQKFSHLAGFVEPGAAYNEVEFTAPSPQDLTGIDTISIGHGGFGPWFVKYLEVYDGAAWVRWILPDHDDAEFRCVSGVVASVDNTQCSQMARYRARPAVPALPHTISLKFDTGVQNNDWYYQVYITSTSGTRYRAHGTIDKPAPNAVHDFSTPSPFSVDDLKTVELKAYERGGWFINHMQVQLSDSSWVKWVLPAYNNQHMHWINGKVSHTTDTLSYSSPSP